MGAPADAIEAVHNGGVDAIAMADILHYERVNIGEVRNVCRLQAFRLDRMNKFQVVIIDYGVGNLLSVKRAVEACGEEAITSRTPKPSLADRLILPGVGAFANGMNALTSLGLVDAIKSTAASGVPLLGICLGMQLLFNESEEYGLSDGLGIIPGRVLPVPSQALMALA